MHCIWQKKNGKHCFWTGETSYVISSLVNGLECNHCFQRELIATRVLLDCCPRAEYLTVVFASVTSKNYVLKLSDAFLIISRAFSDLLGCITIRSWTIVNWLEDWEVEGKWSCSGKECISRTYILQHFTTIKRHSMRRTFRVASQH